jgi:regulator of replication initiation timing
MARTIDDCREEMHQHIKVIRHDIVDLAGPRGRLTRLQTCVDLAKRNVARLFGILSVLSLVVGLGSLFLTTTLGGITDDVDAAQKDVTALTVENTSLRADLSHVSQTMQELKTSMNQLKTSMDELNRTYLALLYSKSTPYEVPR